MGLAKFRSDYTETQTDGAVCHYTRWLGGPTLAKVSNCRWLSLQGEPRLTVHVQGEPDTYFSIPAKAYFKGKVINGYLTSDDNGNNVFRHVFY